MTRSTSQDYAAAVAIIGMAGRFPDAPNVEQFWKNIAAGVRSIRTFSDEELLAAGLHLAEIQQPNYVKAGTVVDDHDLFDASFFGYPAREAEVMDPQHRLFLECTWEALERAAYDPQTYRGQIGIFGGSGSDTYMSNVLSSRPDLKGVVGQLQLSVGNDQDTLTSTVSYKLNLRGPSVAVQTCCSTSLVAVHLACQSLLTYECDIAIAGGVMVAMPHGVGYPYEEGGILSPDGHCRAFDAKAQGSVSGNGLGVVILKRMEEALADGDHIYAVIRGSAVNNDGIRKVGYTSPGLQGQTSVIAIAQSRAGVKPETVSYIEAHGTGTPIGDSIELAAMTKAFQRATQKKQFCAITSAKPNVGHLDRASGVTGLIKAAMALYHKQLPPSIDFESPNPEADMENSPFYVNTVLRDWPEGDGPRRAGVNSFGLGGTNAHVVLEEAPARAPSGPSRPYHILVLSAKSEAALEAATDNLVAHLESNPKLSLADLAYTLQTGRAAFNHRRMILCNDLAAAANALSVRHAQHVFSTHQGYRDRPLAMLFPDADTAAVGMARDLYQSEETFRTTIDRWSMFLMAHLGQDLRTALYPGGLAATPAHNGQASASPPAFSSPTLAQAATFITSYALVQQLMKWGVQPQALVGYGVGEYVVACIAGVLSIEDALTLLVKRAECLAAQPQNGQPAPATYSSATAAFSDTVQRIHFNAPQIPYISSVSGTWITSEQATDPRYWAQLLSQPIRFAESIDALWQEPSRVLLEIGPGHHLIDAIAGHPAMQRIADACTLSALPAMNEWRSDQARLISTLGHLWLAGVQVQWADLYANEHRYRLLLPTYPFERRRYWIEAPEGAFPSTHEAGKKADIAEWFYLPVWKPALVPFAPNLSAQIAQQSPWLIFTDDQIGPPLIAHLLELGGSVVQVRSGASFSKHDDTTYTINPAAKEDYQHLLRVLPQPPQTIIHLWSCAPYHTEPLTNDRFDRAQNHGFYSLLYLAKAISSQLRIQNLAVWVLSQHAQRVTGGEILAPEHATLVGGGMVIGQEQTDILCRHIDIDRIAPDTWQGQQLMRHLLAEFVTPSTELAIAYRHGERWTKTYEHVRLEAPAAATSLRPHGVYLITGGLGGVGMVLAEHLARTVQAKIALTTRTQFPPSETWEHILATYDTDHPACQRIRILQSYEALGAEILILNTDVADEEGMRTALQRIQERFGALHGVIHAAGSSDEAGFASVQDIDHNGCELHFKPKVYGLLTLERVLADQPLDFCILYSSLASVLGGLGFMGYTAANSFMDAWTYHHNQQSPVRWTSVNWDTWGIKDNPHGDFGTTVLDYAMTKDEAIHAFERIVAAAPALTQLVNSTGDLETRISQWVRMEALRAKSDTPTTLHPRPDLLTAYVAPSTEAEQVIAEIWQAVLGIEVGVNDNFLELGGNSLIGTQIVTRLRRTFQTNVPLTILFESPTVADMAITIETILIEEIERLDEEEVLRLAQTGN